MTKRTQNINTTRCSHRSVVTSLTTGFLRFLTRFSGRRRVSLPLHNQKLQHCHQSHYINNYKLSLKVVLLLVLSTIIEVTDACNSRTVPRPRTTPAPQVSTTTSRPNITFQTFTCPPDFATWYCLNGATCFLVKIGDGQLYNCECPDGYIGPRCDYKDLDGSYLAGRPRVMLETASIAGGAVAALFLTFIVGFVVYVRWHQNKKSEMQGDQVTANGHHNEAADVVDGPCYCQQSQVHFSQLSSARNGEDVQHPQQQQFHAVPHHHHPKRPFGPHHYHPTSMAEVLERRQQNE